MPLSNEDNLRLNVLSAQPVKAIRINESSMVLTGLTYKGEARIELCPNQRHEAYLREVRNFLSEKYLGMPGGYPRHLGHWTRMGNNQHSLEKMLLLGEPEAIIALVRSSTISAELARCAWWVYQSAEIARHLLHSPQVVDSSLGTELAQFLLEFLPFEEQAMNVVNGVALCLQGNLINAETKRMLWERARRKNPYYVGFMLAGPRSIPYTETAHPEREAAEVGLTEELSKENPYAQTFVHFLSSDGQKWLKSLQQALKKPTEPNVVIAIFVAIEHYIKLDISERHGVREIEQAWARADAMCAAGEASTQINNVSNKLNSQQLERFKAMLALAQLGDNTLNDIFGGRDASGTVMRTHLQPLTSQINNLIKTLTS
jgi:hypothetical protein